MGKLSLFNKSTQENFNAKIALEIQNGTAVFLRPIKSWELLSPYNYKSGKIYEGQNFVNLLNSAITHKNGAFLTYKQIQELGGFVKENAKAQEIIFWSFSEKHDKETGQKMLGKDDAPIKYAFLKRFNVFNLAQTTLENLPTKSPAPQDTEQLRQAVLNFVNCNQGLISANSYNEFFAKWAAGRAYMKEDNMATSWCMAKSYLIAELVNLFICSKISADFTPIYSEYQEMWAGLFANGYLDFIKCAKIAKETSDELLTWQNLEKLSA